jgi:hypothetical protein
MGAGSRRTWRWLRISSCVRCLAIAASVRGMWGFQQQGQLPPGEQPPVFRAERNEVEVVVIVRDGKGHPVSNLKPSDFEIRDNGKPQSIGSFAMQGPAQQETAPQPTPTQPTAVAVPAPATPSADAAEVASARSFLKLASREVEHYIEAFADLTADETRVMQSFDDKGFPARKRSIQSALVVYRLRNDPKGVVEYREVISIDGHEVKEHAARAARLWRKVVQAHSAAEEVKRLKADGERYDIGLEETGLTLFEGLPLRSRCAGDFVFREALREIANGRPLRVFVYRQVHPCNVITYHFGLPPQFADSPLSHAGELRLDAETGQVVREERSVYVDSPGKTPHRIAHIILSYDESRFGVLVPKTIEAEIFLPRLSMNLTYSTFLPYASTVLTYGSFSRFEVSVGEKAAVPVR